MNSLARFSAQTTSTWPAAKKRATSVTVSVLLLVGVVASQQAVAQQEENGDDESTVATEHVSDDWRFTLTLYPWAISLDGDVTVKGRTADIEVGFDDIFDKLDYAGLIETEVRKGRWGLFINAAFLGLEDESDVLDATISGAALGFGGYYRLGPWPLDSAAGDSGPVLITDVYAGGRYTYLDADLEGERVGILDVSETKEWVDPIIGARTTWDLSPRWMLSFRGDVGGFGVESDLVWQASGVVGYKLGPSFRLFAGYRAIGWDYDEKSGSERFEWDVTAHGPVFGVSWSF